VTAGLPLSLGARIAASLQQRADAPALLFEGETTTAAVLGASAAACAAALAGAGVGPGDRVAVGLGNSPELVVAVLGTLHAGATLVPLNPAYTPDEVRYVVGDARPRVLIAPPEQAAAVQDLPPSGRPIVHPTAPTGTVTIAPVPADPESPALIVYTSGTTGRPKGAMLSHRALLTNLTTVATAWHWSATDRLLLALPCFHLHGLGLGLLMSYLVGSSVVLRRRFVAEDTCADLARTQATVFFGVPTMYNRLVALPDAVETGCDLDRMRLWVSGSAGLPATTFERFRERFRHTVLERYGMTECGFALSGPYDGPRRAGVVGPPLPGVEVRLVDPDRLDAGELVDQPDDTAGELLIRGPNLFSGYWDRPEETRQAFVHGYLRSGDIAVRESDGMYRIIGRASVDIIKSRGFKIGAGEIEDALQRHPAVQDAAVVGVPDADQGQRVVAVVTARPGMPIDVADLHRHARTLLAPHKVPAAFVVVDDIPRVGPGKFKKQELIAQLVDGRLRPTAS